MAAARGRIAQGHCAVGFGHKTPYCPTMSDGIALADPDLKQGTVDLMGDVG